MNEERTGNAYENNRVKERTLRSHQLQYDRIRDQVIRFNDDNSCKLYERVIAYKMERAIS